MNLTEDYCSFETSKLLKEKGFDEPCFSYYKNDKSVHWFEYRMRNSQTLERYIMRPYYGLVMKWLREVHKIFISIGIGDDIDGVFGYMAEIYCLDGLSCPYGEYRYIPNVDADTISDKTATTYEEAVEAALKYVLENLI